MLCASNKLNKIIVYQQILLLIIFFSAPETLISAPNTKERYDVIIIGAGISGLAAARELRKKHYKILVLEARNRIGGRVWSISPWGVALDLGASWLHGIDNNPVSKIMKQAAIKSIPTIYNSDNYRLKLADTALYDLNGEKIPQAEIDAAIPLVLDFMKFIERSPDKKISINCALKRYAKERNITGRQFKLVKHQVISSYVYEFAANLDDLSIEVERYYRNSQVSGKQVIFPEGYIQLVALLAQNIPILLNQPVKEIHYNQSGVRVDTEHQQYYAHKVIITVPVSLLRSNKIMFTPSLPTPKKLAISQAKMGTYDKVFLYFNRVFWDKDKEWIGMIQPQSKNHPVLDIMNYYKFSQQPILLIFNAGKQAEQFEQLSDNEIISTIMEQLRIMYGTNIPDPSSYFITRWHNDPYAIGSYSYLSPGASNNYHQQLAKPVNNRLFFAGEATSSTDPATVHGAYLSGIRASKEVEKDAPIYNTE